MELAESDGGQWRVVAMFPKAAAKDCALVGAKNLNRADGRHVTIKIDSVNWKMFILGGIIACITALQQTVQIFDPSTVRSVVLVGGVCAIIGGLRLRRRFDRAIDRKVQGIIAPYK
jgi:hypothetical protein